MKKQINIMVTPEWSKKGMEIPNGKNALLEYGKNNFSLKINNSADYENIVKVQPQVNLNRHRKRSEMIISKGVDFPHTTPAFLSFKSNNEHTFEITVTFL